MLFELTVSGAGLVVLKTIKHIRGVKIVHPMQVPVFTIEPGRIWSLTLGRILDRLLRQVSIGRVTSERESPREQACASVFALCTCLF